MNKQKTIHRHKSLSKHNPPPIAESEIDVLKLMVKSTLGKKYGERSLSEASFGNICVNFIRHELFKNGKLVPANAREMRLLKYFLLHEGEVLSRDQLLQDVWGFENNPTTRSIDNYVLRLRKKIEIDYTSPRYILTVHGIGYQFKR
jgi:DNA-binding response OmpR family regulator